MKQLLTILFIAGMTIAAAAQTPYTGGNGSGYAAVPTPALACPSFWGGLGDGAVSNTSPVTICPPFFGGMADGYASQNSGCLITLPLRRIDLRGERQTNQNLLYWTLTDGFEAVTIDIERSADGNRYIKAGTVAGQGDAAFRYQFIDTDPHPGVNFYRLRITERDGTVTYSRVLVLSGNAASFISLYPNPARGSATLYYQAVQNSTTRLLIWQYDGRLVRTQLLQLARGANYILLDLQGLAAGLYIISLNDERVRVVVE